MKRLQLIGVLLVVQISVLHSGTLSQNQPPFGKATASGVSTDHFIGTWKLNASKTHFREILTETIKIETQGKDFKFTFDLSAGTGSELHWWYITTMKGEIVEPTETNGQPTKSNARITRIDAGEFKVESAIQKDEYKVSADGQTMKLRRKFLVTTANDILPESVQLIFDRVR